MEIYPGKTIITNDEKNAGEIEKVVVSPVTHKIESLVVQRGSLFSEERVVPARLIAEIKEDTVRLRLNAEALQSLPQYKETHYIDSLVSDRREPGAATLYYLHPTDAFKEGDLLPNYPSPPIVERTIENIPSGSYVIDEGSEVLDREGDQIGEVEQIIADRPSHAVTHFVISRGLVFETEKLIPIQWVNSVEDGRVNLAVEKDVIEQLPEFKA